MAGSGYERKSITRNIVNISLNNKSSISNNIIVTVDLAEKSFVICDEVSI